MICPIEGVIVRELRQLLDERGWLMELFRRDELPDEHQPMMGYLSVTKPGIARGPHEHQSQSDQFIFCGSSIFRLYLWDNRASSPTHLHFWHGDFGAELTAAVVIPPGVVHAYKNIGSVDGMVFNIPNRLFAGPGRAEPVDEIRHELNPDSAFRIDE
jgi:dTDP-4-dehydrorhamnose 3,5-epimerase